MATSRLHELSEQGVSVWIDSLSREMLETGELARLLKEDAVVGVTSNPTIFQKALSTGDWYDEQLATLLESEDDPTEIFVQLAMEDVRRACDLMRPVWDEGEGLDGWVSLEVDPTLAYDREATFEQAMRFHAEVDRPNLFVKIPATLPGLAAIEDSIAKGKSINVTLIFSLDRYAAVAEAYIRGLERLVASGGDPTAVASVASFFVSRVDSEADRRLEELGNEELQGKLAIANARLAYEHWQAAFSGPRWEFLAGKGATPQRCLWASTSTKNPEYRDVMYVEELIGPKTVNTMPAETVVAFQDHGKVAANTITKGLDEAHALLEAAREGRRRLRRRRRDARGRGRAEVRRLVRGAAGRHPREAQRARPRVSSGSVVERIWAYDASLWTDSGEDRWLGWLDVVARMRGHVDELNVFAEAATEQFHDCVLLGMGGSSLAPEVLRRTFDVESFHVLDTTHPEAIRRLERELDLERTLFLASSKSGGTIETRSQLEYFWERTGGRGAQFAAITDPGSELDDLAHERGFRAVFAGEPEIGGRYSALSMFGMVPAALMGVDLERFLQTAAAMMVACHEEVGQSRARARPATRRGLAGGPRQGLHRRVGDRLRPVGGAACSRSRRASMARGSFPRRASRPKGPTGSAPPSTWSTPTTSPASSTAGSSPPPWPGTCSGSIRSTSRTCRRRRTRRTRCWRRESRTWRRAARSRSCSPRRIRATTSASRPSSTRPARKSWRRCSRAPTRRAAWSRTGSGRATCTRRGSCTRAARTPGSSSRSWTIRARSCRSRIASSASAGLIRSQAAGDLAALEEQGRRVIRIQLEDV